MKKIAVLLMLAFASVAGAQEVLIETHTTFSRIVPQNVVEMPAPQTIEANCGEFYIKLEIVQPYPPPDGSSIEKEMTRDGRTFGCIVKPDSANSQFSVDCSLDGNACVSGTVGFGGEVASMPAPTEAVVWRYQDRDGWILWDDMALDWLSATDDISIEADLEYQ